MPGEEESELQTQLLDEIHAQISTAHSEKTKTLQLVGTCFYWPTWQKDVEQYVQNCVKCKHAWNPQDKTPGLLQSLSVPEQSWQHIAMDFRSFPRDKKGYDTAFVVVD